MYIDRAIARILAYAAAQNWGAAAYARAAKIPQSTVNDLLRGRGNPSYATIAAMESVIPADFDPPIGVCAGTFSAAAPAEGGAP